MARRKSPAKPSFMMFNVVYEDGTLSSNRKVSSEFLDQRFGEDIQDLALAALAIQDEEIFVRSGVRRAKIKSIARV
ncbi:MAG: hypothetical protein OXR84_11470 [Magnetovibrio sp.]|nr:hypothetical protein [Magnetovibrio sp.]